MNSWEWFVALCIDYGSRDRSPAFVRPKHLFDYVCHPVTRGYQRRGLRLRRRFFALFGECASEIWKIFLYYAEGFVARHRESKANCPVFG